jgi:hypothetical protein
MNTTATAPEYLLLFRGTDWQKGLSPQQLENTLGRFMAWFEGLQLKGKIKAASPLQHEGKIVSGVNGEVVLDGPFAESKEAVGGYFLLNVTSEAEAVAIARQAPQLAHGAAVEVRPVAPECPMIAALRDRAALVPASFA